MFSIIVKIILMVLTLLVVVPAATNGNVAVRQGGFIRGLLVLLCIGLLNHILWLLFALATIGGIILANWLTFGLVSLLVNALAFKTVGNIMPGVFKVKNFGSALFAALIMTVVSYLLSQPF